MVFFYAKIERGNARGRKGSIRDLQSDRQLHRCGTDRIHRDRHQLRYAGSTPRHSPDQPELLLPQAADCSADHSADHEAEAGADRGGEGRTNEDGVVEKIAFKQQYRQILKISMR